MKATVSQEKLAHGLGLVSRAVAARSTLPVLGNILIASDEGRLRLSATNLELGITCWIGAKIQEEGSTTVPARTFSDLVTTLPANNQVDMSLTVRTQTLNVRCGASNFARYDTWRTCRRTDPCGCRPCGGIRCTPASSPCSSPGRDGNRCTRR